MATWKVMLFLAAGLVLFATFASVFDLDFGSVGVIVALVLSLLFGVIFYYTTRFGYKLGKRRGPDEE